jgi:hypothetical protein
MALHRFELYVPAYQQRNSSSCWWTTMRMVLEYYGQPFLRPEDYRSFFRRPVGPGGGQHYQLPTDAQVSEYRRSGRGSPEVAEYSALQQARGHGISERTYRNRLMAFSAPSEWYEHGIPNFSMAVRRLIGATDFRTVTERPAPSGFTGARANQLLRRFGPMIVNTMVRSAGPDTHWVLIVGAIWNDGGGPGKVIILNPMRGDGTFEVSEAEFTGWLVPFNTDQGACFPLHLPATPPVAGHAEM